MAEKTIIVFSPHPDDETIGMGGTIAKEAKEGNKLLVVIMTDGRHAFSTMGINSDPTPDELKEIRKNEAKRALEILGVCEENVFFLDFEDGTLESNQFRAEEKILALLAKNPPSEIYFTHEKDAHTDHRAAYRIVRSAVRKSGFEPKKYQYSILQSNSKISRRVDFLSNSFHLRKMNVDVSDFVGLKKVALLEYKSQTTIFSIKQQSPIITIAGIENHLQSHETFYKDKS